MDKLGLYIHIPFCTSKCYYCDFYSIASSKKIINKYLTALYKEIEYYSKKIRKYKIDTIYIGGGTPSILTPSMIGCLIKNLTNNYNIVPHAEITIESNPESLSEAHLQIFKQHRINRISLGIQSFNNKILKTLNRITNRTEIISKIKLIKKYQIKHISFDFILGIPFQPPASIIGDMESAIKYHPDHLSIYTLMMKKGSKIEKIFHSTPDIFMTDEEIAETYTSINNLLEKSGYSRYEISNFSLKKRESRHNLKYWNMQPYLGFGASAVSTINNKRWKNIASVQEYIDLINTGKSPVNEREKLDKDMLFNEKIMLQLRLRKGLNLETLSKREQKLLNNKKTAIERFKKLKLIMESRNHLLLTLKGVMLSNQVISELMI